MIKVFINDQEVQVNNNLTILQACEKIGITIPRFCYHERLSIAGNCRMCLVEVEKSMKPVASCAMPVMDGMRIKTDTQLVKKAREGVMEFLLANHPLDCPICDQGGECDLQDQAMVYGNDRGRFFEYKRAVEDKNCGPLVKTIMTRCIHCTRCVRFATEVAGVDDFGVTGRGQKMEIGTYVEKVLNTELSGNVIDICPVGALTNKPYAFKNRPWELRHTESIDVLDAVGSNIRIDSYGNDIVRILPRLNEDVNEEWISDKTRFAYDALKVQRLNDPMVRTNNGSFKKITWKEALNIFAEKFKQVNPKEIGAIVGQSADVETMVVLKDFVNKLGIPNIEVGQANNAFNLDYRQNYTLNTSIKNIENCDLCLLIGANPRFEAPLVNTRIRKAFTKGATIASIGKIKNPNYDIEYLGDDLSLLSKIADGKHKFFDFLKSAKNPIIILGTSIFHDKFLVNNIFNTLNIIKQKISGTSELINVLHTDAGKVGSLDLGLGNSRELHNNLDYYKNLKLLYLLEQDNIYLNRFFIEKNNIFTVYQGHHGDHGAKIADLILPTCPYTEKKATYVNTEGRVQHTNLAFASSGKARENWKIFKALSYLLGFNLQYNSYKQVKSRLNEVAPLLNSKPSESVNEVVHLPKNTLDLNIKNSIEKYNSWVNLPNSRFFINDAITRSSVLMAKCHKTYSFN